MKNERYRILFVHHSVGRLMLSKGNLRSLLNPHVQLWDHDYNRIGLTDWAGVRKGRAFPIPNDNTDPSGLIDLCREFGPAGSLRTEIQGFDCLAMKSCYPNNAIASETELGRLRSNYRELLDVSHDIDVATIVLMTSPPLVREKTDLPSASRAIKMSHWLLANWPDGRRRLVVDIFGSLADSRGTLAWVNRGRIPFDSHPGKAGCRAAAEAAAKVFNGIAE